MSANVPYTKCTENSGPEVDHRFVDPGPYPVSRIGACATVAVPFVVVWMFDDLLLAGVIAIGCLWLSLSFRRRLYPELSYSACRLYLPIFLTYNLLGAHAVGLSNRAMIVFLTVGSVVGFAVGWLAVAPSRRFGSVLRSPRQMVSPTDGYFRSYLVIVVAIVTCGIFLALWIRAGELPVLSSDPNLARTQFFPSGYVASVVVMGLHVLAFVGAVLIFCERRFVVGIGSLTISLLLGYSTANRGVIFIPLIFAALFVGYRLRANVSFLVPFALVGISVFSYLGFNRGVQTHGESNYSRYIEDLGYSGHSQMFGPAMKYIYSTAQTLDQSIVFFPSSVGHSFGLEFFSPLLLRQSVDLYLKDAFGGQFDGYGVALGSMNAFYIDWGFTGVLVGSLVLGLLASLLFFKGYVSGEPRWIAVYCYFLTLLILSNYGHPFAYLYYIVEPLLVFFLIRPSPAAPLALSFIPAKGSGDSDP
ncbi:hypothetical protein QSJ19_25465 [Gordonia sp. ABSL11-1]|uniref:hypothetical protein n=1 Tax=Gordonia sp. ABSL11-1 TaxID=3053924 RepID=UPI0025736D07|nr:hypothetical protein [Gordonia sp. ABSL11-1]MDL9948868.1 hypothetical protein [Gordonia sp. ABSL11-1]